MTLTQDTQMQQRLDFAARYTDGLLSHVTNGCEETLMAAYELAREALEAGTTLADFGSLHHAGLRRAIDAGRNHGVALERAEAFLFEGIAVYDMALRGYKSNVAGLRKEIVERRRIEEELRKTTAELERQRDVLDTAVGERTRELRARNDDLLQSNRLLAQTNHELSDFTYALSHDLKTPINTIDFFLTVLQEDFGADLDPEVRETLDVLSQTATRMRQLIDDVLHYSRVVGHAFEAETVDLAGVVEDLVADLRGEIAESGARITAAPLPPVLGSGFQLRIMLRNLLNNAVKFRSPDRTPEIGIHADRTARPGYLRLSIADNGIGIDPEMVPRIFDLFQRLHNYDEYQGSGIGLALCKRVAENHGSEIRVTSEPGRGTTFRFDLKCAEAGE